MTVGLLTVVSVVLGFGGSAAAVWFPPPSGVEVPIVSGLLGGIPPYRFGPAPRPAVAPGTKLAPVPAAASTSPLGLPAASPAAPGPESPVAPPFMPPAEIAAATAPPPAPPAKPSRPQPPIAPRELHSRVAPAVVALVVSGAKTRATVASGVLVTASGLVLTSRRAIGEAVGGAASIAMVRSGSHGRFSAADLAKAVPARLVAVSTDLDLAVVEAMPRESVFYPHLPIARRTAAESTGVLAVGHAKKRGLWSATILPIGPVMGRAGADRWLRKLPGESSLLDPGTPLVDAVGRVVGLVIDPVTNGWRLAVDAEGLLRFLLAARAPELRFAGVPPYRRPPPGIVGAARTAPGGGKDDTALPPSGLVPARATGSAAAPMPGVARKGSLDRRFPTAPSPLQSGPLPAKERSAAGGAAVVAFEGPTQARSIVLPELERQTIGAAVRVETADAPERGSRGAPVTIVQFGDYHAPETRDVEAVVRALVEGESAPARLLWKDADRGDGDDYHLAARAARAAGEQEEFWPMHDRLLRGTSPPTFEKVRKLARELDLDQRAFVAAMASDGLASAIESEIHRAAKAPLLCTPAFIVNGQAVDGGSIAGPALRAAVDDELVAREAKVATSISTAVATGSALRPQRTIAPGAPVTGAAFDPAKMARVIAGSTARQSRRK